MGEPSKPRGAPTFNNSIVIEQPAAVVGGGSLRLNGSIISNSVLSKRGGGMLTISGPQNNARFGAGLNVLAGRVNLNSDAGAAPRRVRRPARELVLKIGKGEGIASAVVQRIRNWLDSKWPRRKIRTLRD
jgi:hypothetical protein